jgi:hypothetical protein
MNIRICILISLLFCSSINAEEDKFSKIKSFIQQKGENSYQVTDDEDYIFTKLKFTKSKLKLSGKGKVLQLPTVEEEQKNIYIGKFYNLYDQHPVIIHEFIIRKKDSYSYKAINIHHDTKTYEILEWEHNIPLLIIKNQVFFENEGYFSVIKKIKGNNVTYIDSMGIEFTQKKYEPEPKIVIPKDYKKEKS